MEILSNLFASKTQAKLIGYLFKNANQRFYQRQLCSILSESLGSIQYELKRLENLGILKSAQEEGKKFYFVNKDFLLYPQLRDIIFKVQQINVRT